jgi:hypothetical protein
MKTIRTRAASISAEDVSTIAAQGVARALEARKAAGEELNAEQVGQVGGAAAYNFLDWTIAGGKLLDLYASGALSRFEDIRQLPGAEIGVKTFNAIG